MKTTLTIIALLALGYTMVTVGYDRSMVVHCNTLLEQSKQYEHFEITRLDHDECKNVYGIEINAPIK